LHSVVALDEKTDAEASEGSLVLVHDKEWPLMPHEILHRTAHIIFYKTAHIIFTFSPAILQYILNQSSRLAASHSWRFRR
jgi:hypothetical protein